MNHVIWYDDIMALFVITRDRTFGCLLRRVESSKEIKLVFE